MTVTGQPEVDYTFDLANRLTRIQQQGSPSTILAYDEDSRRTSLTLPNNVVTTYCYDNNSRLTGLFYGQATQCSSPSGTLGTLLYGYDALNRRNQVWGTFARTGLPQPVGSASYDSANELLQWNGQLFTYDLNGNMTSDGTNTFTWDARNQLSQFNAISFQYDAAGRRTKNAVGNTQLYDGSNSVQELSGTAILSNRISGGVDEFFNRTESGSGNGYTPLTDALGSTIAMVNSSGNIITSYVYDPFGNTTVSGSSSNQFQYTGRENDANGLYYYRARYYNPALGRFISEDPSAFGGGNANFYAYVGNDPTNSVDPSGEKIIVIGDQQAVNQALAYLRQDHEMAAIIDSLDSLAVPVIIVTHSGSAENDMTLPTWLVSGWFRGGLIPWDPHSGGGCDEEGGGAQLTPAFALGHELVHASHRGWKVFLRSIVFVKDYGNLEEQVTVNVENNVARHLGEGIRFNHGGVGVRVPTPVTKPKECGCQTQQQQAPTM